MCYRIKKKVELGSLMESAEEWELKDKLEHYIGWFK